MLENQFRSHLNTHKYPLSSLLWKIIRKRHLQIPSIHHRHKSRCNLCQLIFRELIFRRKALPLQTTVAFKSRIFLLTNKHFRFAKRFFQVFFFSVLSGFNKKINRTRSCCDIFQEVVDVCLHLIEMIQYDYPTWLFFTFVRNRTFLSELSARQKENSNQAGLYQSLLWYESRNQLIFLN